MTRINLVPVQELTRQHLVAEYRELPRIYTLVVRAIARGEKPNDKRNPLEYTLGAGHCRFFYNKMQFIWLRHWQLCEEMDRRGYTVNYLPDSLQVIEKVYSGAWFGLYFPTETAIAISRARIRERIK